MKIFLDFELTQNLLRLFTSRITEHLSCICSINLTDKNAQNPTLVSPKRIATRSLVCSNKFRTRHICMFAYVRAEPRRDFPFKWYANRFNGIFFFRERTRVSVVYLAWGMYNVCYRITPHPRKVARGYLKSIIIVAISYVWFLKDT